MLEQLYNAIFIGSIYALFAVGFALVFSVLDILNLAHPTVFMLGAFTALFVIAIVLMLGLTYVVRATSLGRDIRALAENPRAARILGVDVERAIAATFFISSGLGGLAGVLLGFAYDSVDSKMGLPLELRAFTVMVVGGMGSLPGAVLGAYILGLGEVASLVYLPAELSDAFAFGLLFIVLVLRPSGLLGQRAADRV